MNKEEFIIREAKPDEYHAIGQLMVNVYSNLKGFPKPEEQPKYYNKLTNVGDFIKNPGVKILVAVNNINNIGGAVVYFSDMQFYGSGGLATKEKQTSGFRLLAVGNDYRGNGLGKKLSTACVEQAKGDQNKQVVIHSTRAMQVAWNMYEKLGFVRAPEFDFNQGNLAVFGFRLLI